MSKLSSFTDSSASTGCRLWGASLAFLGAVGGLRADALSADRPSLAVSLGESPFTVVDGRGGSTALTSAGSTIQINAGSALSLNSAALAAFNRAADQWEQYLADPVTIRIDANLASLGTGILGQAGSAQFGASFNLIRNAMVADNASGPFSALTDQLPTASTVQVTLPGSGGWSLQSSMYATAANLEAMGFDLSGVLGSSAHANITFSSDFAFDYDRSDGIGAGLFDFEGVALHEIGHALGFISEMDYVDSVEANGGTKVAILTPWDLFRFREDASNPSSLAQFNSMPRNLDPSLATVNDTILSYLGSNPETPTSTGTETGDGSQASHWRSQALLGYYPGAMLPSLAPGQQLDINLNDLVVLDNIGWDVNYAALPEPGTWTAIGAAAAGVLWQWRRRSSRTSSGA